MGIATLFEKVVNGNSLDATEKDELLRDLKALEGLLSLVSKFVVPGTGVLAVNELKTTSLEADDSATTFREIEETPQDPDISVGVHVYLKGDKLIFQFNDAGTLRYKYLALNGVGVTWVHSLTAP